MTDIEYKFMTLDELTRRRMGHFNMDPYRGYVLNAGARLNKQIPDVPYTYDHQFVQEYELPYVQQMVHIFQSYGPSPMNRQLHSRVVTFAAMGNGHEFGYLITMRSAYGVLNHYPFIDNIEELITIDI